MNSGSIQEMFNDNQGSWVLLNLAERFDEYHKRGIVPPLTDENIPVVNCFFDPYSNNIIAPDHCIAGLTKALLKVYFAESGQLRGNNDETTAKLDRVLTATLSKLGIKGQTCVYNRKTESLNGLSMSILFALIAILPSILVSQGLAGKLNCFKIINTFSMLVGLMYWWPNYNEDDLESFKYVHNSNEYYDDLRTLLFKFVDQLQEYYVTNGINAASIDSPNLHRLMELVIFSIPTFGHCLLFAQLPFEAFHQCLKRNLSKNTTRKSHVSAIKCVILMDWLRRLSVEMANVKITGNDKRDLHNYRS